jgi:nucleotide-binding universal stress UspA family protein
MSHLTRPPVLAGYDASPPSADALDLAAAEAAARALPLRVVHVHSGRVRRPTETCAPEWDDPLAAWRLRLEEVVARVRAGHPGLTVGAELLLGRPAEVLARRAGDAALLVLGRRRGCGLPLGSVATAVLGTATVPVVVHRPVVTRNSGPAVLVGVEAAADADPVLAFAFLEASLRRAPLTALHLWSRPAHAQPAGIHPDAYGFASARAEEDRMLAEALAGWAERYPEVPVHRSVWHTLDPAVTLADASRCAQLVVVGATPGRQRGHGLLGSMAQTLADHAGCPVAVVPTGTGSSVP